MQTILFFDLDATLVQNNFSWKAVRPLVLQIAEQSNHTLEEVLTVFRNENATRQKNDPDNILTMDWQDIMQSTAQHFNVMIENDLDARWQQVAHADDVEVLDSALEVLQSLKAPHRKIILSTKGLMKYQQPVLEVTGLLPLFNEIITPDRAGYLKTTPAYFGDYLTADVLKIQVGDHYYDDVICAKRNGFHSILRAPMDELVSLSPFERVSKIVDCKDEISTYPDEPIDILPDAVVVSLTELPEVIATLEAKH